MRGERQARTRASQPHDPAPAAHTRTANQPPGPYARASATAGTPAQARRRGVNAAGSASSPVDGTSLPSQPLARGGAPAADARRPGPERRACMRGDWVQVWVCWRSRRHARQSRVSVGPLPCFSSVVFAPIDTPFSLSLSLPLSPPLSHGHRPRPGAAQRGRWPSQPGSPPGRLAQVSHPGCPVSPKKGGERGGRVRDPPTCASVNWAPPWRTCQDAQAPVRHGQAMRRVSKIRPANRQPELTTLASSQARRAGLPPRRRARRPDSRPRRGRLPSGRDRAHGGAPV